MNNTYLVNFTYREEYILKNNTRKLVLMSLMVAYSLALYLLETIIPNPMISSGT